MATHPTHDVHNSGDCAAQRLHHQGFALLRNAVPAALIDAVGTDLSDDFEATPFCAGGFYGERTKRFGRLLARSPSIQKLVLNPEIVGLAEAALLPWCDNLQLNLTQAIEIHPGALPQFPHRDQDMWRGPVGAIEYLVNVIWPLTPFRQENGATLIWPGSHGAAAIEACAPGMPIVAECDPGDAIVFLGSTLHGAGGNVSALPRRALIISYCLGWLKPYENQWLAYPGLFAAYNAGPARYAAHLRGKASLPAETRAYLAQVAGASAVAPTSRDGPRTSASEARPEPLFAVHRAAQDQVSSLRDGVVADPSPDGLFAIRRDDQ